MHHPTHACTAAADTTTVIFSTLLFTQIYREKVKAAAEGRPFTPPPPSAVQVSVNSSSRNSSSSALGGRPAGATGSSKPGDDWGDWGNSGSSAKPAAANGSFSSNSEYSRAQYMASAANKEDFFARKMQENNSKPDHIPPSQGGKYVGFGSTPPPRPQSGRAPPGSVDDVTQLLSKGLVGLGQVAGLAAATATTAVSSGTQGINQLLQEKQVAATLQQTQKVVAEKAQVGGSWYDFCFSLSAFVEGRGTCKRFAARQVCLLVVVPPMPALHYTADVSASSTQQCM